ncbi:hypothetical protein GCM10023115_40120 [Pontixanthobacter gangjinensis]|uniref:Uncharacterized protein n=1 Tax=Christiangramia aestuarii TaxID=1028746 RepID=A0A7K1LS21_9FLAO|nr:hypothetical protein [Christiangramia aestuarii]MUP43602.1 hypothetical protein [Christiangramia aestuarii]
MIWFNIRSLEEKLIRNEISEKTGYYYLLAFFIILSLALNNNDGPDIQDKYWRLADIVTGFLIMVFGLRTAFKINAKGDNRDFLKRYFSLSFVHGVRLAVLVFIIALFFNLMFEFAVEKTGLDLLNSAAGSDFKEFSIGLLFNILFYFLLIRSFKKINAGSEKEISFRR